MLSGLKLDLLKVFRTFLYPTLTIHKMIEETVTHARSYQTVEYEGV